MDRNLELALVLYDARRALWESEGRALYVSATGYAANAGLTREQARAHIVAALKARSDIATRGPGPIAI